MKLRSTPLWYTLLWIAGHIYSIPECHQFLLKYDKTIYNGYKTSYLRYTEMTPNIEVLGDVSFNLFEEN